MLHPPSFHTSNDLSLVLTISRHELSIPASFRLGLLGPPFIAACPTSSMASVILAKILRPLKVSLFGWTYVKLEAPSAFAVQCKAGRRSTQGPAAFTCPIHSPTTKLVFLHSSIHCKHLTWIRFGTM